MQDETKARCTTASPCATDAAPVCHAVAAGGVLAGRSAAPGMVSTFSWSGWCQLNSFYEADHPHICASSPWAACMTAPCWRQGEQVLCECPVKQSTWIDISGTGCDQLVSSIPGGFDMRVIPGAQYALPACKKVWPDSESV